MKDRKSEQSTPQVPESIDYSQYEQPTYERNRD